MTDDTFERITCGKCGIAFWMPTRYTQARRDDHETFYCPNGHPRAYLGDSEADKLRRERDRLKQANAQKDDEIRWQREQRESAERSASAYKGQITKLKKRAANGVCPCCSRHFTNLERHMKSQHPEFSDAPDLQVIEGGKSA